MNDAHVSADLPAFALGALDAADRLCTEDHLRGCVSCREELDALAGVGRALSAGRTIDAPASVWRRIDATIGVGSGRRRGANWRWFSAAAAALAILGLAAWNVALQVGGDNADVAALASRSDGSVIPLAPTVASGRLTGRLYVSDDGRQGGLAVSGLDFAPDGMEYQIWFIRADQTRADGGRFRPDARGQALVKVDIPGPLADFVGVGISPRGIAGVQGDILAGPIYER